MVCIEFDTNTQIVRSNQPCDWGMKYQSVIGFGKAQFLKTAEEKSYGLDVIMKQYSDICAWYPEKALKATAVMKIKIDRMAGKQSGV